MAYRILATLLFSPFSTNAIPRPAPVSAADSSIESALLERTHSTAYAPVSAPCPDYPLVRRADGLSSGEESYVSARKPLADSALSSWLQSHGSFNISTLPTIGFASSGGGYRSLFTTAGIVQGFDSRDSSTGVSGLFQGLTYHAGISGGAWLMVSLAANNWPTITSLKTQLWEEAFQFSSLVPQNILSSRAAKLYEDVAADVSTKQAAGYNATVIDPYGRLLSYQLIKGDDAGISATLHGLSTRGNFTSFNVPYPIMVANTVFPGDDTCYASTESPIFEFHPYEYGSWDDGVAAFAKTQYIGTPMNNGISISPSACINNYDNIGYISGTTGDIFNAFGEGECFVPEPQKEDILGVLEGMIVPVKTPSTDDLFGLFPNPFFEYDQSSKVKSLRQLTLTEGGQNLQNNPIWPFIQPERNVDILIVNDNTADTNDNFPNGTQIRQTYSNAEKFGLSRMPFIPEVDVFVSKGLNKRATFFGCDAMDKLFIVFLPNVDYNFASNLPTQKVQYTRDQTDGMIRNGQQIATQGDDADWPFCLACAVAWKGDPRMEASKDCNACFDRYCYRA